jgi:uncharacterized membrane protein
MSREFMALILLSFLVAAPAAWIMMNNWLDNYAYRIGLSWWIFPIAGLASVLIALFTVSFQSFKAVRANPVKTLRAQ